MPGIEIIRDDTDAPTGNRFLNNSSFSKAGLVIDLGDNGVMPNEPRDRDPGFNNPQNFPVLSSAKTGGGTPTIEATLESTPNTTFRDQFFSKPFSADPDVEGMNLVGEKFVSTGANGSVSFTFQPSSAVALGDAVTATATTGGNTSEFSAARTVVAQ